MMALVPPQLVLSLDRAALSGLYPWLEAECLALGMAERALQRLHVAVEEAVMNVAMHAYAPDADGKIWLTIARQGDSVVVSVEDEGRHFDPASAPLDDKSAPPRDVGGLGLKLLRHYCPEVTYRREQGRNRLEMPFALK